MRIGQLDQGGIAWRHRRNFVTDQIICLATALALETSPGSWVGQESLRRDGALALLEASLDFQTALLVVVENVVKLECLLFGSGVSSTEQLL